MLCKGLWEKLNAMSFVQAFSSKSTLVFRTQAAKEYVKLWCVATKGGEQAVFEAEWDEHQCLENPGEKRREDTPSAVTEFMLLDTQSASRATCPRIDKPN